MPRIPCRLNRFGAFDEVGGYRNRLCRPGRVAAVVGPAHEPTPGATVRAPGRRRLGRLGGGYALEVDVAEDDGPVPNFDVVLFAGCARIRMIHELSSRG